MTYQLLAADMDGTLLNSQKEISQENVSAINRALELGKTVIFSTGRCIAELEDFLALFPKMRYVLCESGACVFDRAENRAIYLRPFEPELAKTILDYARKQDVMPQVLVGNHSVMSISDVHNLHHFQMEHYQRHFDRTGLLTDDAYAYVEKAGWNVEKICLYHTSPESRAESIRQYEHLPVAMALAETTSLELSPLGVDKGVGLEILCQHLNIPIEATIAVGDSFNDLSILKKAGLAVAVDNAVEPVKAVCQAVVADNDHHGVREAIETYLLK